MAQSDSPAHLGRGLLAMALLTGLFQCSALAQDVAKSDGGDDFWYFTFQIENLTGDAVRVRVIEGGEPIIDVALPRSLMEINAPEGYVDPDPHPVSLMGMTVPLHESTEMLDVEALAGSASHGSFRIAGFTRRPDLDFRIVVSKTGIRMTQDFKMPDVLTDQEHRMSVQEVMAQRALQRRGHPQTTFLLLNHSGRPVSVAVRLDGREVIRVRLPGEKAPSEVHIIHEPDAPYAKQTIPFNPRTKTLEVEETGALKTRTTVHIKDLDTSGGGEDFLLDITDRSIDVTRGTWPY